MPWRGFCDPSGCGNRRPARQGVRSGSVLDPVECDMENGSVTTPLHSIGRGSGAPRYIVPSWGRRRCVPAPGRPHAEHTPDRGPSPASRGVGSRQIKEPRPSRGGWLLSQGSGEPYLTPGLDYTSYLRFSGRFQGEARWRGKKT